MNKPSIPKGTRDFLPVEMVRRNYIFDTIKAVFKKYGFLPIDCAIINNNVEAVKVLAPFTKELKIHESLASRTNLSNVLNLMKSLIEERRNNFSKI